MKDLAKIRLNNSLSPVTRVYLIARELHEEGRINDDLWYSILDLNDKYLLDIQKDLKNNFGIDVIYNEEERRS